MSPSSGRDNAVIANTMLNRYRRHKRPPASLEKEFVGIEDPLFFDLVSMETPILGWRVAHEDPGALRSVPAMARGRSRLDERGGTAKSV